MVTAANSWPEGPVPIPSREEEWGVWPALEDWGWVAAEVGCTVKPRDSRALLPGVPKMPCPGCCKE